MGILRDGRPRLLTYGVADELAATVGLTCGGTIRVWVEHVGGGTGLDLDLAAVGTALAEQRALAIATRLTAPLQGAHLYVEAGRAEGWLGTDGLTRRVIEDAAAMLTGGATGVRSYGLDGDARQAEVEIFIQSLVAPARMYVFGSTDFAAAAASMGKQLGYRVTACDARSRFLTPSSFPVADELVHGWPDEFLGEAPVDRRTAIVVLTHDPKFDFPRLLTAMGSRRTCEDRARRLAESGIGADALARIRSPIGLDIGARTPAELAVAIAAELIALRYGRPGGFLSDRSGAVHLLASGAA